MLLAAHACQHRVGVHQLAAVVFLFHPFRAMSWCHARCACFHDDIYSQSSDFRGTASETSNLDEPEWKRALLHAALCCPALP